MVDTKDVGALYDVEVPTINKYIAKNNAESQFEKYRIMQDKLFECDFDKIFS